MKPILTGSEYRRVDKAYQGDLAAAMEKAGHAVALAATRMGYGYGHRVSVLAGPGNNGGDGYVAARFLKQRGCQVTVHALGHPKTELSRAAREHAVRVGVSVVEMGSPVPTDLVIDSVFGGGARGGLPEVILDWMATKAPVISVDFPTGLDHDTGAADERAFVAVETITFSTINTGHVMGRGPEHCGSVTVADIGIHGGNPSLILAEESDAQLPSRDRLAHKWSAGSVLVVGGSQGMVGAAVLAGESALRFGAGSVVVASSQPDAIHQISHALPTVSLEDDPAVDRFDVVVAGPGLAEADIEGALPLVEKADRLVLDAGGLVPELVAAARTNDAEVVVTPHHAEFRRIAGSGMGTFAIRAYARSAGVIGLRKGNPTMVTDGGVPVVVGTGGPELATIGTGDVLAGMIGALMARGLDGMDAAVSGAYWHGIAGSRLRESGTVTAPELSHAIASLAW